MSTLRATATASMLSIDTIEVVYDRVGRGRRVAANRPGAGRHD
jgi:hypothetical protein